MSKTIDTLNAYTISGQTLQDICDAAKEKRGIDYIQVSDLAECILDIGVNEQTFSGSSSTISTSKTYRISGQVLSDICDAIRTKTGSSDDISITDIADEIEEIPVRVSDLSNTFWVFNESVTMPSWSPQSFDISFFAPRVSVSASSLDIENLLVYPDRYIYFFNPGALSEYGLYEDGWGRVKNGRYYSEPDTRYIHITGGTDATNTDLIDWLYENATQTS